MKIISVFGYSSSGKTYFIQNAIKLIKNEYNINIGVIKNIHHHEIDTEGKDSFKFREAGATYSVLRNIKNYFTIFLNNEITLDSMIEWLKVGPFPLDLLFLEGFRNTNFPSVLCSYTMDDIKQQINENVNMISGKVSNLHDVKDIEFNIPVINILKDFPKFLEIFKLQF